MEPTDRPSSETPSSQPQPSDDPWRLRAYQIATAPDKARKSGSSAGRHSLLTADRVYRILTALAAGNTRRASYGYGGISEVTFRSWLDRFRDFRDAVLAAESQAEVMYVAVVMKAAQAGDFRASIEWLKRRKPDEWSETHRIQIVESVREMVRAIPGSTEEDERAAVAEVQAILNEAKRRAPR